MIAHDTRTLMAHDDTGGDGRLVLLLPGAGDVRSEHRFLPEGLAAAGHRVVTADLPGHGESPVATEYSVASTAAAIVALIESLNAGPAVVVANSFAPAAAVWAAADRPELITGIVAISPHLHGDDSVTGRLQRLSMQVLLRGPWAAGLWAKLYAGWYKSSPPADLELELAKVRSMFADPARRAAARQTLTADRDGVDAKIAQITTPTLTVFGSADDHFPDPGAAAIDTAAALGGSYVMVDGAGHYPHVEQPAQVMAAISTFLEGLD